MNRLAVTILGLVILTGPVLAKADCATELARWEAVLAHDLKTGHVAQRVHDAAMADIARIRPVCEAGRGGEALRQIRAAKAKYGYR
jgi:hypothetical protein